MSMRALKPLIATLVALVSAASGLEARAAAETAARAATQVPVRADPQQILRHVRALTGADSLASSVPAVHATAAAGDRAAEYIATQLMSYGLRPAGDDGTYFQAVPMTEVRTLPDTSLIAVASDLNTLPLRNLEDVVTSDEAQMPSAYFDAPIVFVGYGIQAPEYGWDDYKDADLSGKVALVLANEPAAGGAGPWPAHAPTRYAGAAYKFAETARRGAVAALIVHGAGASHGAWSAVRSRWSMARFYWRGDPTPRLRAASWIEAGAARRLAALAGLDLDGLVAKARAKDFTPIGLPVRLQAHVASEVRPVEARNVLAVLPGRGASAHEAVLYTALYERLPGDTGPDERDADRGDNATGVATLLETARLWSQRAAAPERMIVFAALPAVGHGLPEAGCFFATQGALPPGQISLALNLDPLAPDGGARALAVRGAARTSFAPTVAATAQGLGLGLDADPYPASADDYDSLPYRLALAGIPSISLAERPAPQGERTPPIGSVRPGHSTADRRLVATQFAGDATLARLGRELGVQAAARRELIGWLPGDEFEAVRKASQITPHSAPLQRRPKPRR